MHAAMTLSVATAACSTCRLLRVPNGLLHRIMHGATTSAPTTSPIHHVSHAGPNEPGLTKPPARRESIPIVALTVVQPSAANTANLKTSSARSNAFLPCANRNTRYAPATASRVFPTAIPNEVPIVPAVVMFTRKAPRRMAGQSSSPAISSAAIAIPVGAQTGLALGLTSASLSPSFPVTKYAAATITVARNRRGSRERTDKLLSGVRSERGELSFVSDPIVLQRATRILLLRSVQKMGTMTRCLNAPPCAYKFIIERDHWKFLARKLWTPEGLKDMQKSRPRAWTMGLVHRRQADSCKHPAIP